MTHPIMGPVISGPHEQPFTCETETFTLMSGGTNIGNLGGVEAQALGWHGQPFSAEITLPPLGVVWLVPQR